MTSRGGTRFFSYANFNIEGGLDRHGPLLGYALVPTFKDIELRIKNLRGRSQITSR